MTERKDLKSLGAGATEYEYSAPSEKILETFENKHIDKIYLVPFSQSRDEFTSLCPVTLQSDHAKMEIIYVPNLRMVESKTLKLYLFSFRNHGEFHEDVTNRIAKDLYNLVGPKYLRVFANFAPRGGISIKPLVEIWQKDLKESEIYQIERLTTTWDIKNAIRR